MKISGDHWIDDSGRRLVLRGANLGGDCKVPVRPDGDTRFKEGFYEGRKVSFVGRPFPLEEADEHFERLAHWGFTFFRFLTTWEAVEHEGPGIYDEDYLDYLDAVVGKARDHGLSLFIDPHQDVWSRWTGGDGAPMWTLEAAGFEPSRLFASGAAILNQEMGKDYPRMVWFSNYDRLACATMWTLFFAGDTYAPGIGPVGFGGGTSMQQFLQGHYIAAMAKVAKRLAKHANVVGMDSLNEPSVGYSGWPDVNHRGSGTSLGITPTPFEAMLAGEGLPQDVEIIGIKGLRRGKVGMARLGAEGARAWKDGVDCIWRRAGVWALEGGRPEIRKPGHFANRTGLSAADAFIKPFMKDFARGIRAASPESARFTLFVEGVPSAGRPTWGEGDPENVVDASHWYDDLTLVTKKWRGWMAFDSRAEKPVLGPKAVRRYFARAMCDIKTWSRERMGGIPALLGEYGIPFDMNGARAYRSGDYGLQEEALAANYDAVDESLIDTTIWNYTAGNRHDRGDLWNGEDLSIFCRDDYDAGRSETGDPIDRGGRALRGFVRPYAMATAGEIVEMRFDTKKAVFTLRYRPDHAITAPTEIYIPEVQYPKGFGYEVQGGEGEVKRGRLLVTASLGAKEVLVRISRG